uniref:Chemokine interleukin-8-like domain-containing protein n=1 Tax=Cyprinus carpio TaxID=7962 RepID=A0A8C1UXJ3_CYPCA
WLFILPVWLGCLVLPMLWLCLLVSAKSKCCGEFSNVKIPVKLVTSYYRTSSNCARRAIV